MRRPAPVLALPLLLVLTACSGSSKKAAPVPSPTTAAAPTTSSAAPATTGAAATTGPATPATTAAAPGPAGGAVPAGFYPLSITHVSVADAWVLGSAPSCAAQPCTSVVRTRDGGASWQGIPAPKVGTGQTQGKDGVASLRFADQADGYAFGPSLQVTHDGGATWHPVTVGDGSGLSDLEVSAGFAYTVVGTQLFRSSTSSDTWTPVAGVSLSSGGAEIALHGSAGYVLSRYYDAAGMLFHTTDGTTWATEASPCTTADYTLESITTSTDTAVDVTCMGGHSLGSGQVDRQVYGSVDGGAHFTRLGDPPQTGALTGLADAGGGVAVIADVSAAATDIERTGDGAKTWQTVFDMNTQGASLDDLGFTDATHATAILTAQPPVLYASSDAGRTWGPVRF